MAGSNLNGRTNADSPRIEIDRIRIASAGTDRIRSRAGGIEPAAGCGHGWASSFAAVVIIAKVLIHSPDAVGSFQYSADAERFAALHCNRIRLLRPLSLDRLPLEEAIDRDDAAALPVRLAECRQPIDGLAFGVDRLSAAGRVLAPVRIRPQRRGSSEIGRSDDCAG
jgi:hypothetical protein